jgi:hypothetical protein
VIFAGAIFLLMMLMALVIDVSWYWVNSLRVQRAADASALAGAVLLPSDRPNAYDRARKEAAKNGYTAIAGVNDIVVTPLTVNATPRRLSVTISAPIGTFFMRVVGISEIPVRRTGNAEYTLPVPMGSPENYYGVFGLTRGLTTTETTTQTVSNTTTVLRDTGGQNATQATPTSSSTGWQSSIGNPPTNTNMTSAINSDNNSFAFTNVNNRTQQWGSFGFQFPLNNGGGTTETFNAIEGVEVDLGDVERTSGNNCGNGNGVRIRVQLSWNNGASWSGFDETDEIDTNDDNHGLGDNNSLQPWTGHTWVAGDFTNSNFLVRWTTIKPNNCNAEVRVDEMEVRVHYSVRRTTTTTQTVTATTPVPDQNLRGPGAACLNGVANCFQATGANLNPRGFWGTLLTQGAGNINGDAYQPYYDDPTSRVSPGCSAASAANRACYDPITYYNYAIEMPPNSTGGSVYIYDPVFCEVDNDKGTGDRWFGGTDPVSTFYEVYNTRNTLYDQGDDIQLASSGGLFRNIEAADSTMGGNNGADECRYETDDTYGDGRDYHNKWYLLYSGLTGGPTGTIYRVHTTSTDPSNAAAQRGTDGENSFAIYAGATGGTPRVYGLGAMQAFTPLKASTSGGAQTSEFYLAQLEAAHHGKTVEIQLWDPGDTTPLTASIQILIPTGSGWTATPVTYSATTGTTNPGRADGGGGRPNCTTNARTTASTAPIVTFQSGGNTTGRFNGCWLTILAQIPNSYTAAQNGWWKIAYTMTGTGTSNDVTTWQVSIRGNPVHLIVP